MVRTSRLLSYAVQVGLLLLVASATADDGYCPDTGNEMPKYRPTSVQMMRERVQIFVEGETIHTICDFWFKNHGPATTVRMGFPSFSDDKAYENDGTLYPKRAITHFLSTTDGKKDSVHLKHYKNSDDDLWDYWFLKSVSFKAGQTRHVRDTYDIPTGGQDIGEGEDHRAHFGAHIVYVLTTGASWKGNIERAEIDVHLGGKVKLPLRVHPSNSTHMYQGRNERLIPTSFTKHDVWCNWHQHPRIVGRTLEYVARNFKPTKNFDLYFDFTSSKY